MKKDTKGFYQRLAWVLPKELVYHCMIRGWANATTGKWRGVDATRVTVDDALRRWDEST